jgi:hypothetical protein
MGTALRVPMYPTMPHIIGYSRIST